MSTALPQQLAYWEKQDASVDGMLGGFGSLSDTDVVSSLSFLDSLLPRDLRGDRHALDVGAGIGRVTKHMLLPAGFRRVDMLEANQRFLDEAVAYVAHPGLGTRHCAAMSQFVFGDLEWHVIWIQWVAIYLNDDEFVDFFRQCGEALVQDPASYGACVWARWVWGFTVPSSVLHSGAERKHLGGRQLARRARSRRCLRDAVG